MPDSGTPVERKAAALLGAAAALLAATSGPALLLPHIDRPAAASLGPAVGGALLAAGWWAGARRTRPWGRAGALLLGALAATGGCAVAAILPTAHRVLVSAVLGPGLLPYHALLLLGLLLVAAPAALPCGALLGLAVGDARRGALVAALLGAAAGLALAPHLNEVLLGAANTLRVASVLAGAASILIAERAPRATLAATGVPRLLPGGATAILAACAAAAVSHRLLLPLVDLGTNTGPWLAAFACLGAALGCATLRRPAHPVEAMFAVGLPLLLPSWPVVRSLRPPPLDPALPWQAWLAENLHLPAGLLATLGNHAALLVDLGRVAAVGLPLGFVCGRLLASRGSARPLAALAALATLGSPLVFWGLLPRLGIHGTLALLGALLAAATLLPRPRPGWARLVAVALLSAGVVWLRLPDGPGGILPQRLLPHADGLLAAVRDPLTQELRAAVDGRAPLGRHSLQSHRLVHLPFTLAGEVARALVVATDDGEAERAALEHEPPSLDWLSSTPVPLLLAPLPPDSGRRRLLASERLLFLAPEEDYDVIVLLPDPRVRRRAGTLGTREFFAEARARLNEGGLFCQWWDLATIDVSDLKAVVASAATAFEATYLLFDHPRSRRAQLGILGTTEPLARSPADVDATLAAWPSVRTELQRVGLDGLFTLCLIAQDEGLLELLAAAEDALHDARPTLGARGGTRALPQPKTLYTGLDTFGRRRISPLAWIELSETERRHLEPVLWDVLLGWQHLFGAAQQVVATLGLEAPPFEAELPGEGPEIEAGFFVQALVSLPDWPYLVEQVLGFAARLEREGRAGEAVRHLEEALAADVLSPRLRWALGALHERRGALDKARTLYQSVLEIVPTHASAKAALARLGD